MREGPRVWIPKKTEIERLLEDILNKLKMADHVSDIEEWIDDALCELECHVSNRAGVERGIIISMEGRDG